MSTYVNQEVINKVMELGADKYIEKSSFLKDIISVLDKINWRGYEMAVYKIKGLFFRKIRFSPERQRD